MSDDQSLYADPMVYDILHAPGTNDEVAGLLQTEQQYSPASAQHRLWLEPACGTGRYLRRARQHGVNGIGFDISEDMIAYAQRRANRTRTMATERYFVGSMTDFASQCTKRVSFAFNLINTIRHLGSDNDMLIHFEQMAKVLRKKAIYAVGLSLTHIESEQPSEDVWIGVRGSRRVQQTVQFLPPSGGHRVEQVISHLCVTTPESEEHRTCQYALRTYSRAQFRSLIRRSCLQIVDVVDEEGSPMTMPEIGYCVVLLGRRDYISQSSRSGSI